MPTTCGDRSTEIVHLNLLFEQAISNHRLLFFFRRLLYTVVMRQSNLFAIGLLINEALLVILCLCGTLILVTTPQPTPAALVEETSIKEPAATGTPAPTRTPTITLTPTQTFTPTPYPTMPLVTPLPTVEIVEPTRRPYIFPTPINLQGNPPPAATRIQPR
jgi:hypothetical protein